jgi:hypothetical protein
MGVRVEVMSKDPAVKKSRQLAVEHVLQEFNGKLPDLKLLAFFDDCDWAELKLPQNLGSANRGFYTRIDKNTFRGYLTLPHGLAEKVFGTDLWIPGSTRFFDHLIYLHDTASSPEVALVMVFAHELQHFVQYGCKRKLWAESRLIRRLPNEVHEKERLNWPDIPHEREARIEAKRVGVRLCGEDAVNRYIDRMIADAQRGCIDQTIGGGATKMEIEDLRFSRELDWEIPYDLASGVQQIYARLRPYRCDFESALEKIRRDSVDKSDYEDVDLSAYFDG